MDKLFQETAKNIKIFLAIETIDDPYEKNVSLTDLNPIPIKAIVSDLTFAKINWAIPGVLVEN